MPLYHAKGFVHCTSTRFLQEQQLTGAEIGTAVHTVMRHVPQYGFSHIDAVRDFVEDLVARQLLTEAEGKVVPQAKIYRFLRQK